MAKEQEVKVEKKSNETAAILKAAFQQISESKAAERERSRKEAAEKESAKRRQKYVTEFDKLDLVDKQAILGELTKIVKRNLEDKKD